MTPWSFADVLRSELMVWCVDQARREGEGIPAAGYLDRLAERAGLPRKHLARLLAGEELPRVDTLVTVCRLIGSARAVATLAEECGLLVCPARRCQAANRERSAPRAPAARRAVLR